MKKLILAVMLVGFAIAGDWKDGYSPMFKDKWLELGITDKKEAIKWRRLKLYVIYEREILEELLKANISADKCDEIAKSLDKYYKKSRSCKDKYKQIISFVKRNGFLSKIDIKNKLKQNELDSRINKINSYWAKIGITSNTERTNWQELNFKMSSSMLRREDGKQIKKLLEVGLNATDFREWTDLHNLKINNPHLKVDYNDRNNIPTIIEWVKSGVKLEEAKKWNVVNIKVDNILKWKNVNILTPIKAKYLIDNSITISDVKDAKLNNITIAEVIEWKNLKIISSVGKILKLKESGYNTPNEFKKVCGKVITNTNFMYNKNTEYKDYCFNGSFKVSEVKSNNKVKVLVPVIGIKKANTISGKDWDLKVETTIIEANNKVNKDFKNSKSKFISGVFKIKNGTFSNYLERITY